MKSFNDLLCARAKNASASLLLAAFVFASSACGDGGARKAVETASARETFQRYCANCHGAEGEGRPLGSVSVPPFKSDFVVKLTDEQLYNWVSRGGGNMPSFKSTLTEEQMRGLVRHVRELQSKNP